MQSKKWLAILAFAVVALTLIVFFGNYSGTHAANKVDSTIGYVDMDRIQKEHPDFISLGKLLKTKENELNSFKAYLNTQLESISNDLNSNMTQEKKGKTPEEQSKIQKKYEDMYQAKTNDLNKQLMDKSNEINGYLNQQKTETMAKLTKTVEEVAGEMKLTLVLDKSARIYGGVDITQAVLDKENGTKTK